MKYRFHRAVISEHFDNIVFYENRLPGLGADYLNEFETVMAHICTAPNFYPTIAAPDIHKAGLKRFPFHVIYRVMPTQIIVLAVAAPTGIPGRLADAPPPNAVRGSRYEYGSRSAMPDRAFGCGSLALIGVGGRGVAV